MVVTMKELLEAGVHFGHQVKRWNPKMKRYIFGQRNGIYIIDLQKTVKMFEVAYNFVRDLASRGESNPLCRDQEAGTGCHYRGGPAIRIFLCESEVAWRDDDQFQDSKTGHWKTQQD